MACWSKKWDFIDKIGTKNVRAKLTEHYYCVACALLYSTVAYLALLKSSFGVCKLKQLELQFNLQDRRAHSVGLSCEGDCFYIGHPTTRVYILTQYIRDIRALLHKVEQFYCKRTA